MKINKMTDLPKDEFNEAKVREDGVDKDIVVAATIVLFLKLKLKKQLTRNLQKRYKAFVREIFNSYSKYGYLPMLDKLRYDVEQILWQHYKFVGNAFDEFARIELGIPTDDAGFNKRLQDLINVRGFNRAHYSANQIVRTTEKDMDNALMLIISIGAALGISLTRKDIAKKLKDVLLPLFNKRIESVISPTETNVAAEQTKFDEISTLYDMNAVLPDGRRMEEIDVKKIWVARFINTRQWHQDAHGQKRRYNQPYDVDGEKLMFPMDISLGASPRNIINCYCSSQLFVD